MVGTITVQNLQAPTSGADAYKMFVPSGHTLYAPGHVLQVVQGTLGTTASGYTAAGANAYSDSGLQATITPKSVNSKVLVSYTIHMGTSTYQIKSRIARNLALIDTPIGLGTAEGGRGVATSASIIHGSADTVYKHSPLTNTILDEPLVGQAFTFAVTYKIQVANYEGQAWYVNRSETYQNGGTAGYDAVPLSTITLMEIAQ